MASEEYWKEVLLKEVKSLQAAPSWLELEELSWDITLNNQGKSPFLAPSLGQQGWNFLSYFYIQNEARSNDEIIADLNQGSPGLLIAWDQIPDLSKVMKGVAFKYIHTHIKISSESDLMYLESWMNLENAPFIFLESSNFSLRSEKLSVIPLVSGYSTYAIGANAWQEVAFVVAELNRLLKLEKTPEKLIIELGVGENFLVESAKFTSVQWLSEAIKNKYKCQNLKIELRARLGYRNKSGQEPITNQIRQTAEALCAVSAGIHQLCIPPYEGNQANNHVRRMAINIGHILREEAHLNWYQSLTYGSYAVNELSTQICDKVWAFMNNHSFATNVLKDHILKTRAIRIKRFNEKEDKFIGMNHLAQEGDHKYKFNTEIGAFGLPPFYYGSL